MTMHEPRPRIISEEPNNQPSTTREHGNIPTRRIIELQLSSIAEITGPCAQDVEVMAMKMNRVRDTASSSRAPWPPRSSRRALAAADRWRRRTRWWSTTGSAYSLNDEECPLNHSLAFIRREWLMGWLHTTLGFGS